MNKKQIFSLILLTIITLGLSAAAFTEYQHHTVQVSAAVVKANSQRDSAIAEVAQHDKAAKLQLSSANAQVINLTNEKLTLCTQLKTAKLSNALCQ